MLRRKSVYERWQIAVTSFMKLSPTRERRRGEQAAMPLRWNFGS